MSKQLTRRYIYEDTYREIKEWGDTFFFNNPEYPHKKSTPNNKENFPYYLQQYIKRLKQIAGIKNVRNKKN